MLLTGDQLLEIMDDYGDNLNPVNSARWWEAAVSELEGLELGKDDGDEDEDGLLGVYRGKGREGGGLMTWP